MACLDMFNADTHQRISFSNDFVDTPQSLKHNNSSRSESQPPVASEFFEFSVSKYTMMPADELFCKGTLLPFKKTTLRDELLMEEEEEEDVSIVRPPKVPIKWKEFWGLKKAHVVTKKADNMSDLKGDAHITKISQELIADKESMDRDVEIKS